MRGSVHSDEYRSIIARLVEVRRTAGITQEQLAAVIGKPQSFISKIERGERRLDLWEFCQVANGLGREPGKLLAELIAREV